MTIVKKVIEENNLTAGPQHDGAAEVNENDENNQGGAAEPLHVEHLQVLGPEGAELVGVLRVRKET